MDIMNLAAKISLDASAYEKGLQRVEEGMGNLTKNMEKSGKAFSVKNQALGKFFGSLLEKTVDSTVNGFRNLIRGATDAYAEYEQLVGGVETLFGTRGAKNAEEYAKALGYITDGATKAEKALIRSGKAMTEWNADSKLGQKVTEEFQRAQEAQQLVLDNANQAYRTAGMSANHYMETATSFAAAMKSSVGGDVMEAARLTDVAMLDMADNSNKMGTSIASVEDAYRGFSKSNFTMLDNLKLGGHCFGRAA